MPTPHFPSPRAHVLAGCFAGLHEARFLSSALAGAVRLEQVQNRARLMARVTSSRPAVLLLPAVDVHGIDTAALVEHSLRRAPDMPVLVLVPARMRIGRAAARAIESGAHVVSVASAADLRSAVAQLLG